MLEPIPELASDLDWVIQSGQVGLALLTEALVKEYYPSFYRLALSFLDDPQEAQAATREAFILAVTNTYRYRSETGAKIWFYGLGRVALHNAWRRLRAQRALQATWSRPGRASDLGISLPNSELDAAIWLAVDRLDEPARLSLFLNTLLEWPVDDIAQVLQVNASRVSALMEGTKSRLEGEFQRANISEANIDRKELDAAVARSLESRCPAPELQESDLDRMTEEVLAKAGSKVTRRKGLNAAKEVLLIGCAILIVAGFIWGMNVFVPELDPTPGPASTPLSTALVFNGASSQGPTSEVKDPDTNHLNKSNGALSYLVQPGDTLESIAARFGMDANQLSRLNNLEVGESIRPNETLFIGVDPNPIPPPEPTPVHNISLPPPLSLGSSSQQVLQRMGESADLWHTLWVDAQFIRYGPPGYIGPSQGYHIQAWISQPHQSLEITGELGGESGRAYANVTSGFDRYFFNRTNEVSHSFSSRLLSDDTLTGMLFPATSPWVSQEGSFRVAETEEVAGRPAIVVDWKNAAGQRIARLWLDTSTGIILRQQQFGGQYAQTVLSDFVVNSIAYEVDLAGDTFSLSRVKEAGFSQGYNQKSLTLDEAAQVTSDPPMLSRKALPYEPAPPGFDAARSQLTFQFLPRVASSNFLRDPQRLVTYLFGDQYYLGRVAFANPWNVICARSPDGRRIAFAGESEAAPFADVNRGLLGIFNLADLSTIRYPLPGATVLQFAFAPDSRRLALFHTVGKTGAVEILDTDTGVVSSLLNINDAKSFVWSPDGQYLAFIGRKTSPLQDEVMVLRVLTGEITYHDPVDVMSGNRSQDWPMIDWGVDFPVEMGGLEACSNPPAP